MSAKRVEASPESEIMEDTGLLPRDISRFIGSLTARAESIDLGVVVGPIRKLGAYAIYGVREDNELIVGSH